MTLRHSLHGGVAELAQKSGLFKFYELPALDGRALAFVFHGNISSKITRRQVSGT
jgi:hypothetical protein